MQLQICVKYTRINVNFNTSMPVSISELDKYKYLFFVK